MSLIESTSSKMIERILILSFIITSLSLTSTTAQNRSRPGQKMYLGVEGAIGTVSFKMKSDIPAINHMPVSTEGGNFGLIFGNKLFSYKIKARLL